MQANFLIKDDDGRALASGSVVGASLISVIGNALSEVVWSLDKEHGTENWERVTIEVTRNQLGFDPTNRRF